MDRRELDDAQATRRGRQLEEDVVANGLADERAADE